MKEYERIACEMLGIEDPIDMPIAVAVKLKKVNNLCEKAQSVYGAVGGAGPNGALVSRQAIAAIIVDTA